MSDKKPISYKLGHILGSIFVIVVFGCLASVVVALTFCLLRWILF